MNSTTLAHNLINRAYKSCPTKLQRATASTVSPKALLRCSHWLLVGDPSPYLESTGRVLRNPIAVYPILSTC